MSTPRFDKAFLDDLRNRTDVVDLVGRSVKLKKAGRDYTALCPFHVEKSPSFTVSQTKQFYHCFGCGAHGNAIDWLVAYSGLEFVEAVEQLAHESGTALPSREKLTPEQEERNARSAQLLDVLAKAKDVFRGNLRTHKHAIDYMKERGLMKETVNKFGLGYAHWDEISTHFKDTPTNILIEASVLTRQEQTGEVYDKFRRRIMFPIHNERGAIIGFGGRVLNDDLPKYMNSSESIVFQKGEELYGLHFAKPEIRKTRTALMFEGYMDVIMLHQHGEQRAVAGLGTSLTEKQLSRLFRMCDEAIFCFDGDRAGKAAADRAARLALSAITDGKTAKFLTIPDDHDPDSYVREHGIDSWRKLVAESSVPLSTKVARLLTDNKDITVPEEKVAVAREATELLGLIKQAPIFHGALKSHIENLLGFGLAGGAVEARSKDATPSRSAARGKSLQVPKAVAGVRMDPKRSQFYRNYALLCGLSAEVSAEVPEDLIDEFAMLISGWFGFAPLNLNERIKLNEATEIAPLRSVIGDALDGIKERFLHLSAEALLNETGAIRDAILRETERNNRAAKTSALFD